MQVTGTAIVDTKLDFLACAFVAVDNQVGPEKAAAEITHRGYAAQLTIDERRNLVLGIR